MQLPTNVWIQGGWGGSRRSLAATRAQTSSGLLGDSAPDVWSPPPVRNCVVLFVMAGAEGRLWFKQKTLQSASAPRHSGTAEAQQGPARGGTLPHWPRALGGGRRGAGEGADLQQVRCRQLRVVGGGAPEPHQLHPKPSRTRVRDRFSGGAGSGGGPRQNPYKTLKFLQDDSHKLS